jgi:cytochrome b involved in lipid metabolism
MNKYLIIGIVVVVLGFGVGFANKSKSPSYQNTQETAQQEKPAAASSTEVKSEVKVEQEVAKTFTLKDIESHKDATSCWTTISGKVYDVTSWISKHPGGKKAILSTCGVDATDEFTGKHGGQGRPESELSKYYIGTLVK